MGLGCWVLVLAGVFDMWSWWVVLVVRFSFPGSIRLVSHLLHRFLVSYTTPSAFLVGFPQSSQFARKF